MTTTPSGWYDDGHGALRWWDGTGWTEHVAESRAHAGAEADDFAPSTNPAKSKLWIVWVVLGVVVLFVVIATAALVPLLIGWASAQGGQSGGVTTADPDQQAAVAAVELYDDAWQNADCDAYLASTTEDFRTQSGLTDCSAFESEAEAFSAAVEDYEVTVTDVREESGEILVTTTETYTSLLGEDGEPLDDPAEDSIDWVYTVVSDGDDWVIDDMQ